MTGTTAAEFAQQQAATCTEKQLQTAITAAAKRGGWLIYHTYFSRGSQPGYPDLHLVHPGLGISIFRELKTQSGQTSAFQKAWLAALTAAGHDAGVWRPIDWFNGTISAYLLDPHTPAPGL